MSSYGSVLVHMLVPLDTSHPYLKAHDDDGAGETTAYSRDKREDVDAEVLPPFPVPPPPHSGLLS